MFLAGKKKVSEVGGKIYGEFVRIFFLTNSVKKQFSNKKILRQIHIKKKVSMCGKKFL